MPPPAESPANTTVDGSCTVKRYRYADRQSCSPQGNGNWGASRYRAIKGQHSTTERKLSKDYALDVYQLQCLAICDAQDLPSKDPRFQFSSMPLHLVAMLVDATEKVCSAVYVQHNSFPWITHALSRRVVLPHLYPLGLQHATFSPPLPPSSSSDLVDTSMAQLCLQ